jgi:NitT/TauT family transport system substrate-binding protein
MTMQRKHLIAPAIVGLLIVATLASAGCLTPATKEFKGTISVGYLTGDLHHLAYFVAKNTTVGPNGKSLFQKYGLTVNDSLPGGYASGPVQMDHFAKGEIGIGYLGAAPAITKRVNGNTPTVVVGVANEIGSALVVRTGISTAKDLKGKTIMVPSVGSIQYFLLLKYLGQNGLNVTDIAVKTDVGVALMKDTLKAGKADGFIAWEPFAMDAVVNGAGKVLVYSKDIWPGHICCVLVADTDFAKSNRTAVVNFLKAHIDAEKWITAALADNTSANYQKLVSIAMGYTGRSEATIRAALNDMKYDWAITSAVDTFFTGFAQGLLDYGAITQANMQARGYANASDLTSKYLDPSFLKDATS